MEPRHCRICSTSENDLIKICDEIRENFYLLTNIHLVNSTSLSNLICQDCKDKLQSTREYVKLLTENEIRLTNEYSAANLLNLEYQKIDSYYPDIKIENEEFELENHRFSKTQRSDSSIHISNQEKKKKSTEDNVESSTLLRKCSLMISKEKVRKSLKVNKEITNRQKTTSSKLDINQKNLNEQIQIVQNLKSDPQNEDFSHLPTTKNGKIICPDCNRPILKSNYKDHINQKLLNSSTLICDLCHKKFHQKSSLECHMHVHLKIKPYTCPENCGKSFYSKHGLYFHYKMHHQPINEFICEICAKSFKQSHLLKEHIDAKHGGIRYKCTYEGCNNEYNTNSGLKRHIVSIHECKIVPCEFCGDLFRTGFSLYQHVRINHKERKFVCEYEGCDKKFVIKTHYRDHLKMHTGKKDFICKLCDASYHKKRNLTRHVEVVHQKSRFYCQVDGCNASLCNKDNYRAHLRKVHASHPEIKELLVGIGKMKPVFLDNIEDADDNVEKNLTSQF